MTAKNPRILILNKHPRRTISRPYLRGRIERILRLLKLGKASVDITLTTDASLRQLNRHFMGKRGVTDVLSFPMIPPQKKLSAYRDRFLGDIVISLDRAAEQAIEQGLSLRSEVLFLVLHSVLHLVGHDHAEAKERQLMQKLESEIWMKVKS